ncbi:ABC transporter permease [Paenibacillus mucilaginosus]|uniref:Binding-protein-dependent transport systems inner membrane component n=3 Tax=Paenibacillus mucilaginosus TaxID=61624 RepID=H6NLT5_9BACL|nr:ABC transporter permease subunit [Paenibacillus mucilaginosus]AEI44073.1 binding-protein-dependent transport systems inner membrane component [Paenibacillus mucilaginosus KNP414]AFC31650.1 binding-protein-dependent transport systems inner membrane component [Paenibacillus mucilaginosus 3016]AFH63995.1 protein lplB [Paenibacillus mucilaginosus K02]MCG7212442.1 ABC transporter permease subunit [Paenibacillus mucilaginosus]WDM25519.1 sugar ABC transporter permease [Paenibacillus mucilaginosus]
MERAIDIRSTAHPQKKAARSLWKAVLQHQMLYWMLLPGLAYFIVYRYVPMFGAVLAFKEFDFSLGILASPWADPWHKHFTFFFESPYFSQLLTNTLLISLYKLVFGTIPPIIVAVLFNECRTLWFRNVVQTLSFMPHFLSWVIVYGISIAFLSETTGLFNRWFTESGLDPVPFLTSSEWFRSVLVGTDMWKDMGWGAIIYLAAMSSIDPTLYEAARVDGAGRLRMIWSITLPGIRNIIVLMLILKLGHLLDAGFEQIYVMYNVHVMPVSDIIDTWVFRVGLEQMNFGLASAVGLFKSLIGLVLVVGSNALAKRWGDEGLW